MMTEKHKQKLYLSRGVVKVFDGSPVFCLELLHQFALEDIPGLDAVKGFDSSNHSFFTGGKGGMRKTTRGTSRSLKVVEAIFPCFVFCFEQAEFKTKAMDKAFLLIVELDQALALALVIVVVRRATGGAKRLPILIDNDLALGLFTAIAVGGLALLVVFAHGFVVLHKTHMNNREKKKKNSDLFVVQLALFLLFIVVVQLALFLLFRSAL
jgi:hypothetical protein